MSPAARGWIPCRRSRTCHGSPPVHDHRLRFDLDAAVGEYSSQTPGVTVTSGSVTIVTPFCRRVLQQTVAHVARLVGPGDSLHRLRLDDDGIPRSPRRSAPARPSRPQHLRSVWGTSLDDRSLEHGGNTLQRPPPDEDLSPAVRSLPPAWSEPAPPRIWQPCIRPPCTITTTPLSLMRLQKPSRDKLSSWTACKFGAWPPRRSRLFSKAPETRADPFACHRCSCWCRPSFRTRACAARGERLRDGGKRRAALLTGWTPLAHSRRRQDPDTVGERGDLARPRVFLAHYVCGARARGARAPPTVTTRVCRSWPRQPPAIPRLRSPITLSAHGRRIDIAT